VFALRLHCGSCCPAAALPTHASCAIVPHHDGIRLVCNCQVASSQHSLIVAVRCTCCIVQGLLPSRNKGVVLHDGNTPILEPMTGSLGNHLIHQPSAGFGQCSSTLASCTMASSP
jgi:hypothetical protein